MLHRTSLRTAAAAAAAALRSPLASCTRRTLPSSITSSVSASTSSLPSHTSAVRSMSYDEKQKWDEQWRLEFLRGRLMNQVPKHEWLMAKVLGCLGALWILYFKYHVCTYILTSPSSSPLLCPVVYIYISCVVTLQYMLTLKLNERSPLSLVMHGDSCGKYQHGSHDNPWEDPIYDDDELFDDDADFPLDESVMDERLEAALEFYMQAVKDVPQAQDKKIRFFKYM